MYQLFEHNWLIILFVMIAFRALFSKLYENILTALNKQGQEPGQSIYFLGLFSKLKDVEKFKSLKVKMVDEASTIIFVVSLAFIGFFALTSIFSIAMAILKGSLIIVLGIVIISFMIGSGLIAMLTRLIRF